MAQPGIVLWTDLGLDAPRLTRIDPAAPDAWLAAFAPSAELPGPGGTKLGYAWRSGTDFGPAGIASQATGASPADLDRLVQSPPFQRVESAWQGVRLVGEQAGTAVALDVGSTGRAGLVAALDQHLRMPYRRGESEAPRLIVLDFDFTHQPADLALLAEVGDIAAELNAPVVAGASPAFFGLRHFAHVVAYPEPMAALADAAHAPWREFQASEAARWICLTLGRYLQRAPHTAPDLAWTETVAEAKPESFLWGRGIWLIAAAAARSLARHGHALDIAGRGGMFADLPTRAYPKSANEAVALATEAPLPEMRASELSWAGFTPVAGVLRASTVLLPMVVTTSRLRPGKLTLEGTLAYQLLAASLATALQSALSAGIDAATAESSLRTSILASLGGIAKEMGEDAIRVQILPPGDEPDARPHARIEVQPAITLEGRKPEFVFEVPLRVG